MASKRKRIVFTFGRFNPPTTGHQKLIEAVAKEAGSAVMDSISGSTPQFEGNRKRLKL